MQIKGLMNKVLGLATSFGTNNKVVWDEWQGGFESLNHQPVD